MCKSSWTHECIKIVTDKLKCKFSPVPYQSYKGKQGSSDILDLAII